jgi:hypothetical protein
MTIKSNTISHLLWKWSKNVRDIRNFKSTQRACFNFPRLVHFVLVHSTCSLAYGTNQYAHMVSITGLLAHRNRFCLASERIYFVVGFMYCHMCHDVSMLEVDVCPFMISHHVATIPASPHLSSAAIHLIRVASSVW